MARVRARAGPASGSLSGVRYFDHNATHPLSATARAAWLDAVEKYPANPSSPHRLGGRAEAALESARDRLARLLGCSSFDICWTSGATESNNAVVHHLAQAGDGEVWISAIEHPCMLAAARRWLPGRHRLIPVNQSGLIEVEWIVDAFRRRRPTAVIAMAANNETGVIQPWQQIAAACAHVGAEYVCDAAQWIGRLPSSGLGTCHYVTGCAHKFGGPPGVGFLKCPASFRPLILGGSQEHGRRAGTENLPGVLAMVAALEEREQRLGGGVPVDLMATRDTFIEELTANLPGVEILGANAPRLWNTVTALMPAASDCRRRWVVKLDKLGFAVSTGSACASGKEQPSHVVLAMGRAPEASDRMLRFSAGWETTPADWAELSQAIQAAAAELGAAGQAAG